MDLALARGAGGTPAGEARRGSLRPRWCRRAGRPRSASLSARAPPERARSRWRARIAGSSRRRSRPSSPATRSRRIAARRLLPAVHARDRPPAGAAHAPALAELGLPYEPDPAVTRHAARVPGRPRRRGRRPRGVAAHGPARMLLNGGVFAPRRSADRLAARSCLELVPGPPRSGTCSTPTALDLAVARGAAQLRARAARARASASAAARPRAYFVGVAAPDEAPRALLRSCRVTSRRAPRVAVAAHVRAGRSTGRCGFPLLRHHPRRASSARATWSRWTTTLQALPPRMRDRRLLRARSPAREQPARGPGPAARPCSPRSAPRGASAWRRTATRAGSSSSACAAGRPSVPSRAPREVPSAAARFAEARGARRAVLRQEARPGGASAT